MSLEVDYLPVATSGSSVVDPQATFAGSSYQENGFVNGIALPNQVNKVWRQSSMMAAAMANMISQALNANVLDDGNLSALVTNLQNAIKALNNPLVIEVPYSTSLSFYGPLNAGVWCPSSVTFETTLTGNAQFGFNYIAPGTIITIDIIQDGTGGHSCTPASSNVVGYGPLDTSPNMHNVQVFILRQQSPTPQWVAIAPMVSF